MASPTTVTTACGVCGAPTDSAYICPGDTLTLEANLLRTVPVLRDLELTYRGGDVRTVSGDTTRTPAGPAPLPWNEAASRLLRDLDRHLRSHRFADPVPAQGRPAPNVLLLCGLALRRAKDVRVIRLHPDAGTYAKELARLLDRADRVIDRRATLWTFGVCTCGTELHGEPDTATVVCSRCNTTHNAIALKERQWSAAAGTLVTQAEAAQWLAIRYDVDPRQVERVRKRINLWVFRGRVTTSPGVVDGREQELVLFGAVDAQWRKVQAMNATKATRNYQAADHAIGSAS